ncbi:hypothetical protein ST37_05955 [Vibrio sp. qd031]|uniref:hypothetical protein n=1 Tax=Vibrio sp. qd031 TaxID=1603038 RepID=UPI000A11CDE9|nr:hypothetical protein [Vibrio sp. qd031]ORT50940.1 hypothetical protein ST37_05955 [Vibrio sp. qd031]
MPTQTKLSINISKLLSYQGSIENLTVPDRYLNPMKQLVRDRYGATDIEWISTDEGLHCSFTPATKHSAVKPSDVEADFANYMNLVVSDLTEVIENQFRQCTSSENQKYHKLLKNPLIAEQQAVQNVLPPMSTGDYKIEQLTVCYCKIGLPLTDTETCLKSFGVKVVGEKKADFTIQLHRMTSVEDQMQLLNAIRVAAQLNTTFRVKCKVVRDQFGQIKSAEYVGLIAD